jgi:RNA polymerase sigma factor (sigma-70 family)
MQSEDNQPEVLLAIDKALRQLAELDPQQARIVELRFFAGLTIEEVAEALSLGLTTVKRDWRLAKAWLSRELS